MLALTVVDASTCKPIKGAAVDIWHADARGRLLGLRQRALAAARSCAASSAPTPRGSPLFKTVYPGWYQGRAVHIHVKVHLGGNVVHTGQLFFPDALTDTASTSARPTRAAAPRRRATPTTRSS